MRFVLIVIALVVAGLVSYNFLTTGTIALVPASRMSDEMHVVNGLRGEFRDAQRHYTQAGRAVAVSGVDTTADAEAALREVERIEAEARRLGRTLTDEAARAELERLLSDISSFTQGAR